jgi:hypothetical protein
VITYDQYAGEKHLVEEFMNYVQHKPFYFTDQTPVFLFIWGYELWMPNGGRHGTAGIIDMLGTDSIGQTWLIEAKHSLNPELETGLWQAQILNYIEVLSTLPLEEIVLQSHRYLTGNSQSMKMPEFITDNCSGLLEAYEQWQKSLNVQNYKETALQLFRKTFNNIKAKNIFCTVLADEFRSDIWENRPIHNFHCGYISCNGVKEQFNVQVNTDMGPISLGEVIKLEGIENSWTTIRENRLIHPSPGVIRSLIRDDCYEMYDFLLEALKSLGWNGESFEEKSKSYVITLSTSTSTNIKVMIGLVDYDASCHSIQDKLAGGAGFKCDIDFTDFKRSPVHWKSIEPVITKIIHNAGYRGRGKAKPLGARPLTEKELSIWDGKITHQPKEKWRDFTGRSGDFEHLKTMLEIVSKAINLPIQCDNSNSNNKKFETKHSPKTKSSVKVSQTPTVYISGISSIAKSIFSFKHKGKLIELPPFILKKRTAEFHEVQYHLDENDLLKINKVYADIFPFSTCNSFKEYKNLTKNSYIDLMKYRFYQHILSGEIVNIMSLVNDSPLNANILWDNNTLPINEPTLTYSK